MNLKNDIHEKFTEMVNSNYEKGPEMVEALDKAYSSRCMVISGCLECPNYAEGASPNPFCRKTNLFIVKDEFLGNAPPWCPLDFFGEWSGKVAEVMKDDYVRAHFKGNKK